MMVSGIYGPQVWNSKVADIFGFESIFKDYVLLDFWVPTLTAALLVAHLPFWYVFHVSWFMDVANRYSVYNVAQARRRQNLPVLPVFLEWTPMVVFMSSCCGWLYSPYTNLLTENHLVLFCLTISFVFGRMTTKIILAHLTKQPFPYWTVLLIPLAGGALMVNGPVIGLYVSHVFYSE